MPPGLFLEKDFLFENRRRLLEDLIAITFAAALSLTGTRVSFIKKAPIETKKAIIITGLIIRVKDMPDDLAPQALNWQIAC